MVNVHTWKKIGLFAWSAVLSCLACALFLGFGLEVVFGQYYEGIVTGIFINNLTFTMALGFPVLIVLTSSDFGLGAWVTLQLCRESFADDYGRPDPGLHYCHLPDAGERSRRLINILISGNT